MEAGAHTTEVKAYTPSRLYYGAENWPVTIARVDGQPARMFQHGKPHPVWDYRTYTMLSPRVRDWFSGSLYGFYE